MQILTLCRAQTRAHGANLYEQPRPVDGSRDAGLVGVLEQIDDEPLQGWRLRKGNAPEQVLAPPKLERAGTLRVVDQGSAKDRGRAEPERIPPFGASEEKRSPVEEGAHDLVVGWGDGPEAASPRVGEQTVAELQQRALTDEPFGEPGSVCSPGSEHPG